MKLSVIIPVYRTERTLKQCVDSVVEQDWKDMEVILVDDASPDSCPALCDQLAAQYPSVCVVHQAHGGLSKARNTGIQHATGDYITFVDSDDTVEPQTYGKLETVLVQHPDYDLIEYPVLEHAHSAHEHLLTFEPKEYTDMRQYWLEGQAYLHTYADNKVYRRWLFHHVHYPEGRVFEDVITLAWLLRYCHKVATTNLGRYNYQYNPEGITATADAKALQDLLDAHNTILPTMHDARYYAHVVNIALDVYDASGKVPQLARLPYWQTAKLFVNRIFGLRVLCIIHKHLHHNHL